MSSAPLTVVIGAGISGLACAYMLHKSGGNVLVLEAGPRPGGVIQSAAEGGYLFELGPQSFSSTPALYQLCDELGLTAQLIEAPHGAPRYVLIDGKLTQVPMSPPAFLASSLLSWVTKFSLLAEPLRTTAPPEADESVAAFARRKFSAQLLDRLIGPFISGIYAGDPEHISLRAAFPKLYGAEKTSGSVVRGMFRAAKAAKTTATGPRRRPSLLSLQSGNETLGRALADKLGAQLCCNSAVVSVRLASEGFALTVQSARGEEQVHCARLIITTPTTAAADLLKDLAPDASPALREITYAPVAVVSVGYRRDQVSHSLRGFGFLAPRSSGLRTLGTVWNSSLFAGRAPHDHVLLTSFVGGATDPEAVALSANDLAKLVHGELAPILGITGMPALQRVTQYHQAIPQYNLGHTKRLDAARQAITAVPGLWVIGNYWNGPAVGACLEHAQAVAEEVQISYNS